MVPPGAKLMWSFIDLFWMVPKLQRGKVIRPVFTHPTMFLLVKSGYLFLKRKGIRISCTQARSICCIQGQVSKNKDDTYASQFKWDSVNLTLTISSLSSDGYVVIIMKQAAWSSPSQTSIFIAPIPTSFSSRPRSASLKISNLTWSRVKG